LILRLWKKGRQTLERLCSYRQRTIAIPPHHTQQELRDLGYFSQSGQDKWVIEKFFLNQIGVFVDIGAHDGISLSNSYTLEKLGWSGLAIEPIPSVYEQLAKNRKCITINGCISSENKKHKFREITGYSEMLSGIIDYYDDRHLRRIESELAEHGGAYRDIEIAGYNLNDLLKKHNIVHIDYLSVDTEGAEYEILNSIDFENVHISIIGVENNYSDKKIYRLLKRSGFKLHSILGADEFYQNRCRYPA